MFHIISFVAFFTILSHIGVVLGWSFQTLSNLSFVPLLCSVGLYYFLKVKKLKPVEEYSDDLNNNKFDYIYLVLGVSVILYISIFSNLEIPNDEGFYSNIENHVLRKPEIPYFKYDDMLGEDGVLFKHVSYKVQSYQLLSAVFSQLFNIPNLVPRHYIFHVIAAFLFIGTWLKLIKLFVPTRWQFGFLILVFLLIAESTHRGLSNFSITRFFDGKCILFYVLMPLVFYYTIIFFRNPNSVTWIYLLIIQIAGIGLSSSALYLFPIQLFLYGLCYLKPNHLQLKKIIIYGLSSIYVVVVAITIKILIQTSPSSYAFVSDTTNDLDYYLTGIFPKIWYNTSIYGSMFGRHALVVINFIAIFVAFSFYKNNSDLRRILFLVPLLMILIILNPLLFPIISLLTTKYTYLRLVFILPIPLFFVILITNLVNKQIINKNGKLDCLYIIIAIFGLYFFIFLHSGHEYLDTKYNWNQVKFTSPRVDDEYINISNKIIKLTPKGTKILASSPLPRIIAADPAKKDAKLVALVAYYLDSNQKDLFSYQKFMSHSLSDKEINTRDSLYLTVTGTKPNFDKKEFTKDLRTMNVGSITLSNSLEYISKIVIPLKEEGYKNVYANYYYQIWIKN